MTGSNLLDCTSGRSAARSIHSLPLPTALVLSLFCLLGLLLAGLIAPQYLTWVLFLIA
jgi:hypothetical protein